MNQNLTDAHREKGRSAAIQRRRAAQDSRRRHVARMRAEGKSKAEIARHFNVNWETINRDCKAISQGSSVDTVPPIEHIHVVWGDGTQAVSFYADEGRIHADGEGRPMTDIPDDVLLELWKLVSTEG